MAVLLACAPRAVVWLPLLAAVVSARAFEAFADRSVVGWRDETVGWAVEGDGGRVGEAAAGWVGEGCTCREGEATACG